MSGITIAVVMMALGLAMIVVALVLRARRAPRPTTLDPAIIAATGQQPETAAKTPTQGTLDLEGEEPRQGTE